jgi:hypothetical protein
VLKTDPIDIRTGQPTLFRTPSASSDDFPAVPVLPETLLRMELRSHELSVDLGEISFLVLSDLGATLQILRLAAREHENAEERPVRVEDCISGLGVQACLAAVSQQPILSQGRHRELPELWAHAREVAQACRTIAAVVGGVHPEEAYLVGLTHSLGSLPALLEWQGLESRARNPKRAAVLLAERWSLPRCVQEFCCAWDREEQDNRWLSLLRMAHPHAGRSPLSCPLESLPAPRLHRVL